MFSSLWGDDFIVKSEQVEAKKAIKKINKPKDVNNSVESALKSKKTSIYERLDIISENVKKILGRYDSQTTILTTKDEYVSYIDKAIQNGVIAVDTETNNSLEPITCKLMGLCLYTPGMKAAYIPVNHTNVDNGERLDWQLIEEDIAEQLNRLSCVKVIMHNGKFDYEVIKCTTGVELEIYWDTMIAAKVLDENERSAGLKQQYIEKIDSTVEKYSIDHLFKGVEYAVVNPNIFALYAATDSMMTYKLYMWQKEQFEIKGNERIYNLFLNIEMPIVKVAAEMELTGVEVDQDYSKRLSTKYHKQLDEIESRIAVELDKLSPTINKWRLTDEANYHPPKSTGDGLSKSKSEQLENPVNVASPVQLAILIYDVLGTKVIDKKSPRGTGEDILKKIDLPICNLILEHRGVTKLLNTYIDSIPTLVTPKTGRVHTHFNQYGAATGRFSSSDPLNLQNIPSSNKEIRLMFKAKDGYTFVGSDYSL